MKENRKHEVTAPWVKKRTKICKKLMNIDKKANHPLICKQKAMEHLNSQGRHYGIFTDGSKSNEGVGCAAIGTISNKKKGLPKSSSIYTAELYAIKEATNIIEETNFQKYVIYSDSQSAINGMNEYNPTNNVIQEIQEKIHDIKNNRDISMEVCWIPAHVGISGNEYADQAAKEAARTPPEEEDIPARDHYREINEAIKKKWQRKWEQTDNANKLKSIKKQVEEWTTSNNPCRKVEVVLTRLRNGHTHLTHSYLMSNPHEPEPICNTCRSPITIKHIFEVCPTYREERRKAFGNMKLDEILGEKEKFSSKKIINFLKETKLIDKI